MKSRILISISAITLLAALAMRPRLAAQEQQDDHHCRHEPKLIEFDGPDAGTVNSTACAPSCGTQVFDNNDMGEIVGSYTDTNIVPHGFLRTRDGNIIPFDAPGAGLGFGLNEGTVAYSINSRGEITGQFQDPDYVFHGFVRFRDGSFDTFDAPGAGRGPGQGTLADSINREGTVAGYFLDENNVYRGFVRARDGTITQFEAPHAGKGKYQGTVVADGKGLNPEGAISGWYTDRNNGVHGYLRAPDGTITTIDAPGAYQFTLLGGINPAGATTGYYGDKNVVYHGLLRAPDDIFTTFEAPGAGKEPNQGTAAFDLNPAGAITGIVVDASNVLHGFLRELCGKFTEFDARDAGTGPNQGTRPESINSTGEIAGYYIDKDNVNHGFLRKPCDRDDTERHEASE